MFLCVEIDAHLYTARTHTMLQLLWYLHCALFFYVKKACFNKSDKDHHLSTLLPLCNCLLWQQECHSGWMTAVLTERLKWKISERLMCAEMAVSLSLWAVQSTVRQRSLSLLSCCVGCSFRERENQKSAATSTTGHNTWAVTDTLTHTQILTLSS